MKEFKITEQLKNDLIQLIASGRYDAQVAIPINMINALGRLEEIKDEKKPVAKK